MASPLLLLNGSSRQSQVNAPTPGQAKLVRGVISKVSGSELFATVQGPSSIYHYGPLEVIDARVPVVGDECLIGFDTENIGYLLWSTTTAPSTFEWLTWSVAQKLAIGSLPGPFVRIAKGEEKRLTEVECELVKGKAVFRILVNGVAQTFSDSSTSIEATTVAGSKELQTPLALKAKDKLTVEVTEVKETPEGLDFTAFIEKK